MLEVRREGHPVYRAAWALVKRGEVVPGRVHGDDPQRVFVDTDAALRAWEAARVRPLERQHDLLRR